MYDPVKRASDVPNALCLILPAIEFQKKILGSWIFGEFLALYFMAVRYWMLDTGCWIMRLKLLCLSSIK